MSQIFLQICIIIIKHFRNVHNKIFFEKMDMMEIDKNIKLLLKV